MNSLELPDVAEIARASRTAKITGFSKVFRTARIAEVSRIEKVV
jgi:hypothetical protein